MDAFDQYRVLLVLTCLKSLVTRPRQPNNDCPEQAGGGCLMEIRGIRLAGTRRGYVHHTLALLAVESVDHPELDGHPRRAMVHRLLTE
jgi:hypothetical protein